MPPPLKMASGSRLDITMAGVGGGGDDGGAIGSAWAEEEDVVESPPV